MTIVITVASHGFFIIAPGPVDAVESGATTGSVLIDLIWILMIDSGSD